MKIVGFFKHEYEDFYAQPEDNNKKLKYIGAASIAYAIEIMCLIIATLNLFLKLFVANGAVTEIKVDPYFYLLLSFNSQCIALTIYCFLISRENPKTILRSDFFYLFLFLVARLLITLRSLITDEESIWAIVGSNFITIAVLALFGFGFVNYFFFNKSIINAFKRIVYQNGFFRENNEYVLVGPRKLSKEKIFYFLSICFFWSIIMLNVCLLASILVNKINQDYFTDPGDSNSVSQGSKNQKQIEEKLKDPSQSFFMIFSALIQAPVLEEILFRQILMSVGGFGGLGLCWSSFIFALTHMEHSESILILLPYFLPALVLGYVYMKFKNILFTIGVHFFYNSFTLMLTFIKIFEIISY